MSANQLSHVGRAMHGSDVTAERAPHVLGTARMQQESSASTTRHLPLMRRTWIPPTPVRTGRLHTLWRMVSYVALIEITS